VQVSSGREQSLEERPVARERGPQIPRRDVVVALPLSFELRALLAELRCETLHQIGNELIRLLDGLPRAVHEAWRLGRNVRQGA